MSAVTRNVSRYVKERGINLSKLSRDTGIAYAALYSSLYDDERDRSLRDDELIAVCSFLKINPMDFADEPDTCLPEDAGKEVG